MLVTGTTVVNGTIEPILEIAEVKAVLYRISIAGLPGCLVSRGSVQGRRDGGGAFLLSLVFYKICTNIIHKLYGGLRFGLVCMECREPRHNRHTVSLLTDHIVVSPKVSRTRKRYVQAPYLSAGFVTSNLFDEPCGRSACPKHS